MNMAAGDVLAPAVLAALDELQASVDHLTRRMLAREDRLEAAEFLPLAAQLVDDKAWTSSDLHRQAHNTPDATALCELLNAWHADSGGLRSFGWFLDRIAGSVHGDFRLECVGRDRAGKLYMVKRVSRALKPAAALAAPGGGT